MTDTNYVATNIRLAHKGYEASAVMDPTDGYLQGMVEGLERDLLSFDGANIAELAANFQDVIEDYLAGCAEGGIAPEIPKVVVTA